MDKIEFLLIYDIDYAEIISVEYLVILNVLGEAGKDILFPTHPMNQIDSQKQDSVYSRSGVSFFADSRNSYSFVKTKN